MKEYQTPRNTRTIDQVSNYSPSNGHIVRFDYESVDGEISTRTVYVVESDAFSALHGIDLKYVPEDEFSDFLDLARQNQGIVNNSESFYNQVVSGFSFGQNPYRTFLLSNMSNVTRVEYRVPVAA